MTMPGGGVFSLLKGQFTDDSEMASHLLVALDSLNFEQSLKEQHYVLLRKIAN